MALSVCIATGFFYVYSFVATLKVKMSIPFLKSAIFPSGPTQGRRNKPGGELIFLYKLMYLKNINSFMKVHRVVFRFIDYYLK